MPCLILSPVLILRMYNHVVVIGGWVFELHFYAATWDLQNSFLSSDLEDGARRP